MQLNVFILNTLERDLKLTGNLIRYIFNDDLVRRVVNLLLIYAFLLYDMG